MTDLDACPMPLSSDAPGDAALAALLAGTRTVAVVGASPDPARTSHQVARWLMEHTPYEIYLVNPRAGDATLMGHAFYPSLAALPVVPDMVDVFRRAEHVPPVAADAIEVGARSLWLQLGIRDEESAAVARDAGLQVVQNRCLKVEYARLLT